MMEKDCQEVLKIKHLILHSQGPAPVEAQPPQSLEVVRITQADTDDQLIRLWLHGRSVHTQRAYSKDIRQFILFTKKDLRHTTLEDLQAYADDLVGKGLKTTSQQRILASIKSLIAYAHKIGYLPYDTGKPLKIPKSMDHLAERILSENDIHRMISGENHPRNKLMLRALYATGIRVSELCRIQVKDSQPREKGGQISIYGKGGKTNTILIPENLWNDLMAFRANAVENSPLFTSRKGRHFNPSQVWRIVRKAARKAGIEKDVSPHWYRHAHASHALQRGASIALVQRTLAHSSVNTTSRYLHVRPEESSSQYLDV
jgi:integrase/recombinase XerD